MDIRSHPGSFALLVRNELTWMTWAANHSPAGRINFLFVQWKCIFFTWSFCNIKLRRFLSSRAKRHFFFFTVAASEGRRCRRACFPCKLSELTSCSTGQSFSTGETSEGLTCAIVMFMSKQLMAFCFSEKFPQHRPLPFPEISVVKISDHHDTVDTSLDPARTRLHLVYSSGAFRTTARVSYGELPCEPCHF